jgi:hypothetical protein
VAAHSRFVSAARRRLWFSIAVDVLFLAVSGVGTALALAWDSDFKTITIVITGIATLVAISSALEDAWLVWLTRNPRDRTLVDMNAMRRPARWGGWVFLLGLLRLSGWVRKGPNFFLILAPGGASTGTTLMTDVSAYDALALKRGGQLVVLGKFRRGRPVLLEIGETVLRAGRLKRVRADLEPL